LTAGPAIFLVNGVVTSPRALVAKFAKTYDSKKKTGARRSDSPNPYLTNTLVPYIPDFQWLKVFLNSKDLRELERWGRLSSRSSFKRSEINDIARINNLINEALGDVPVGPILKDFMTRPNAYKAVF